VKLGKRLSRAIPLRCGLDAAGCGKRIFGGAKERREASMDSIYVALISIAGVKISLIPSRTAYNLEQKCQARYLLHYWFAHTALKIDSQS